MSNGSGLSRIGDSRQRRIKKIVTWSKTGRLPGAPRSQIDFIAEAVDKLLLDYETKMAVRLIDGKA